MKKDKNNKADASILRRNAEERLRAEKPAKGLPKNEADRERLLHELRVHQIELEMQNEELQRALLETEKAKNKYEDFYDFAPVGYLTLTEKGIVSEINLATAGLLGSERKYLVKKPFYWFVKSEYQNTFQLHLQEVLTSPAKQTCELIIKKHNDTFFPVQLDTIRVEIEGQWMIRSVLTDITSRIEAEEALRQSERREHERARELATMLEAVPTPVIIVHNPDATHMTGNRAADELLRQPSGAEVSLSAPPDVRPRHFRAIKDGRELRLDELPAQLAAMGEHVQDFEFSLVFDNGITRHVLGYGTPLLDEQGHPRGAVHVLVDITDRKLTEEALRASEQRFRSYFELGLIGMAITSPENGIIDVNDKICEILGYERSELLQLKWEELTHEDDKANDIVQFNKVLSNEIDGYSIDKRFIHKNRDVIDTTISVMCVRTADGSVDYCVSLVQNITERKQMEQELKQSERLYRAIGESINYGVWVCDPDGRNIYASESFLKMVGLTQEECSSFGWGNVLHPDDAERTIAAWQECVRSEGVWDIEHRYRGVDGRYHYVLARGIPVRDDQGHITCWAGINLDIDHLKQMQEELRQSRDELELRVQERTQELSKSEEIARARHMEIETYYNMTPIGLCILDKELRYVRVNERLAEINGLPVSAHLGRTIREVVPAVAEMAEETANRIMKTGKSFSNIEFTVETAERPGIKRTSRATWFPFKDTNGQVTSIGVMVEEITEQRRLEEQLRQAQKMEAIGTLAGGIAHDFNNILAAIIGFAEMVEEDLPSESPSIPRIQRVLKAAYRGRELVREILAFARKTELTRKPLSLSPLVKETVQLLRASLPSSIEIKLTMKATRDVILASSAELQQIVMNLATNAASAMKEKGGILGISTTDIDFEPDSPILDTDVEPGEYVQLIVTDTGHGMEPHVMKRIFEPFFTTKEVGEGTGMGLPVVYGIVKSLHGAITVESEPGVGSTFRIFLPIARTDGKLESSEAQVAPRGTEHILFVEDEEMLTEWGQAMLERLGYTVTALTDSTEALKLFSSDPSRFDLVITDQTMPKLTGMHLARELLTIRNNIPIILCTGHSDSTSPEKAKKAGIREFLMKPIEKQQLATAVRRVLDTKSED
jgi:PAS domain S-box-containing protein